MSVLALENGLTGYLCLLPYSNPDSEASINEMNKWNSSLGFIVRILSNCSADIKNMFVEQATEEGWIRQNFTIVYCQWENGTVKQLCNGVFRETKVLRSEDKRSQMTGFW